MDPGPARHKHDIRLLLARTQPHLGPIHLRLRHRAGPRRGGLHPLGWTYTGRTAAATVRTLARARSSKVDRVARRGPSVFTTIARAIADCRPPVDRSLDD
eukprot:scaffold25736_cov107-Isochrysis_galbana.AAC.1